ncbi:MAG: CNNM domain-containing protein [Pirellulaceae bacterium]
MTSLVWIFLMMALGVFLSAFFSGSETGFYRVARVRLVLDGMAGDTLSRFLLFLTNHPALFVATTLIGNNIANYLVSLSVVIFAQRLFVGSTTAEMLLPLVTAPVLFVYGELLPKFFFYQAPNFLLRKGGGLFALFTILFAPCSILLWLLGRALQWLLGDSPAHVKLILARKELEQLLDEGKEAGILNPAQRLMAQGVFAVARRKVASLAMPVSRSWNAALGSPNARARAFAARLRLRAIPVVSPTGAKNELVGYIQVSDLYLTRDEVIRKVRPLPEISAGLTCVAALVKLQGSDETMGRVVSKDGQTIGTVTVHQLRKAIMDYQEQAS